MSKTRTSMLPYTRKSTWSLLTAQAPNTGAYTKDSTAYDKLDANGTSISMKHIATSSSFDVNLTGVSTSARLLQTLQFLPRASTISSSPPTPKQSPISPPHRSKKSSPSPIAGTPNGYLAVKSADGDIVDCS